MREQVKPTRTSRTDTNIASDPHRIFDTHVYDLGKYFHGQSNLKKVKQNLERAGLRVGNYGHITPKDGWQYAGKIPFPGFMSGSFLGGYTFYVHEPVTAPEEAKQCARTLVEMCDAL